MKSETGARDEFGLPLRCKNNYDPAFDAPKLTKGYRAMLCNYLYDSGKTWGELRSEVRAATDKVKELVVGVLRGIGASQERIDRVPKVIEALGTEEFGGEAMRDQKAALVVEIQFMTKDYYEMRKQTHAWFKVVRAHHAFCMRSDYAGGLGDD